MSQWLERHHECDRCGKRHKDNFKDNFVATSNTSNLPCGWTSVKGKHLCPQCNTRLAEWLNGNNVYPDPNQ